MIHRIIYEDWQLIFPAVALLVAAMVYAVAAWRTAGMPPAETARLIQARSDTE